MKFKLASIILILYAFIGFAITTDLEFESKLVFANCLIMFVIMPSLCGYGLWLRKKTTIAVSLVLFIFMSVRRVGE